MNPRQLSLMTQPGSGRMFVVLRKLHTTQVLKDVTDDFALMMVAEIKIAGGTGLEQLFEARDRYGNVIEIEVTAKIVSERKETT